MRRLRQPEDAKLKRIVAKLLRDQAMLRDGVPRQTSEPCRDRSFRFVDERIWPSEPMQGFHIPNMDRGAGARYTQIL